MHNKNTWGVYQKKKNEYMGKIHFKLKFYNLGYDMFLKKKKVYENFSFFTNKQTHTHVEERGWECISITILFFEKRVYNTLNH